MPYRHLWWAQYKENYVHNLNRAVKDAAAATAAGGVGEPKMYEGFWRAAAGDLCPKASNAMWGNSSIPFDVCLTMLKGRYGQIHNAKRAAMFGMHPTHGPHNAHLAPCPLCQLPDSCGHMLGGCRHPDMHKLFISRHNKAVLSVAKAIEKGANGGCVMYVDAERESERSAHNMGTRLPGWLLPDLSPEELRTLRPDILLIPSLSRADCHGDDYGGPLHEHRKDHTVHIIEVGYGSDTRHADKVHEKAHQHQRLAELLREAGWKVCYRPQSVIALGVYGAIGRQLVPTLCELGVGAPQARRCANKLHTHAAQTGYAIVKLRRALERSPGPHPPPPQGTHAPERGRRKRRHRDGAG